MKDGEKNHGRFEESVGFFIALSENVQLAQSWERSLGCFREFKELKIGEKFRIVSANTKSSPYL